MKVNPTHNPPLWPQAMTTALVILATLALGGCVDPEQEPVEGLSEPAPVRTRTDALNLTFTVTNTANSGPGSLRQAVLDANAADGLDTIRFAIPGNGPHAITLNSQIDINSPVNLDASTQPGYVDTPVVRITHNFADGFRVNEAATGSSFKALALNNSARTSFRVEHADNLTFEDLDLSSDIGCRGFGILLNGRHDNITIRNNDISNRGVAVYFNGSSDAATVTNNDFSGSGCSGFATRFQNINARRASGNTFTNIVREAIRVDLINGLRISPTAATDSPNHHIQIEADSGIMTGVNAANAISLNLVNVNSTIVENLDLTSNDGCRGNGIWFQGTHNDVTVRNVNITNRGRAIYFNGSGERPTVTGNDFSGSGCHDVTLRLRNLLEIKVSGNTFTNIVREAIRTENISGLTVSPTAAADSPNHHIQIEADSDIAAGVNAANAISLRFINANGVTVEDLDLTSNDGCRGNGIWFEGTHNNLTVRNVNIANRGRALYFNGTSDQATVTGNSFEGSGCHDVAVRLRGIGSLRMSGNDFTNIQRGAFRLENTNDVLVSPTAAADNPTNHIQIEADSGIAAGVNAANATSMRFVNTNNIIVEDLDLTSEDGCRGTGILFEGTHNNLIVRNNTVDNRGNGIFLNGVSDQATVTGNDISNSGCQGYALYLRRVESLRASNNTFTNSQREIVRVQDISGLTISPTAATDSPNHHIQIEEDSGIAEGINAANAISLNLINANDTTVEDLDLSSNDGCRGNGIWFQGTHNNLTVRNVNITNRGRALYFNGTADQAVVTGNDFSGSGCHDVAVRLRQVNSLRMSDNTFTDIQRGAIRVEGPIADGLHISPSAATDNPNHHIQIESDSGIAEGINAANAVSLRIVNANDVTIEDLDLSSDEGCRGNGILFEGTHNNATVRNNDIRNRGVALAFQGTGTSPLVTGNLFTGSGCHGYALRLRGLTDPRISNNDFAETQRTPIRIENTDGLTISPTAAQDNPGNHLQLEADSGIGETTGTSLHLSNSSNITIENLDLSSSEVCRGTGVFLDGTHNNIVIRNNNLSRRGIAVYFNGQGSNPIVTGNDFTESGCNGFTVRLRALTNTKISNNNFTNSRRIGYLIDNMNNLRISPTSASSSPNNHIQIEEEANMPAGQLNLQIRHSNDSIVENLNFSSEENCTGEALRVEGTHNNLTVRNNTFRNRGIALYFNGQGDNNFVHGNDVSRSGCQGFAVRLRRQTKLKMFNNDFTDIQRIGILADDMHDVFISPTAANDAPDHHIQLENNHGMPANITNIQIRNSNGFVAERLNFGNGGNCTGTGMLIEGTHNNAIVRNNDVRGRGVGLYFNGQGDNTVVTGNDLTGSGCSGFALRLRRMTNNKIAFNNFTSTQRIGIMADTINGVTLSPTAATDAPDNHIQIEPFNRMPANITSVQFSNSNDVTAENLDWSSPNNCTGTGLYFTGRYDNVRVRNNAFKNRAVGIYFNGIGDESIITGNDLSGSGCGGFAMRLLRMTNAKISDNIFENTTREGIRVEQMNNFLITDQIPEDNPHYMAIDFTSKLATNTGTALRMIGGVDNRIEKVKLSRIGPNRQGIGLYVQSTTNLEVDEVLVRNRTTGIHFESNTNPSIDCTTAFNNNTGLYTNRSNPLTIRQARLEGNNIAMTSFNSTVDAENIWWGAPNGPTNGGGGGNGFNGHSNNVTFDPFLNEEPPCAPFETDIDGDLTPDDADGCPFDPAKTEPGNCGCGLVETDQDEDNDGQLDCLDLCPDDPNKSSPGVCGCGVPEEPGDDDRDGVINCLDQCPEDPNKFIPGQCGCGLEEDPGDDDEDGVRNCEDECPNDPNKTEPGTCGCGLEEADENNNEIADCLETLTVAFDAPGDGWLSDEVILSGTIEDINCNLPPLVQTNNNAVTFSVQGNNNAYNATTTALADGLYNNLQVTVRSQCSPSVENIEMGTFGVDNTDPQLLYTPFTQEDVDPNDPNTWKGITPGALIPLIMRANDSGSGIASVEINLIDADEGSNVELASLDFNGNGQPPRGRTFEVINRCDDEIVCEDGRLQTGNLGSLHYQLQIVVTDHAGRSTTVDFYFQLASLRQAIVAWRDAVAELADDDPRIQGELDLAESSLTDALQGFDTDTFGNMSLGLEEAGAALRRGFGPTTEVTLEESANVLRLLTGFYQDRRDGFHSISPGRPEFDEAQSFLDDADQIANLPPNHIGEVQEGFLKNANAYFWMEDGHAPFIATNFPTSDQTLLDILEQIDAYLEIEPALPGADAMGEARAELGAVQVLTRRVAINGDTTLTDLEHVQLLLGLTNTAEALKDAENGGTWVRNWQWGLTQIVFIYAQRGIRNAATFMEENNPVVVAGFDQLEASVEFRDTRRADDFMRLLIDSRCLLLGVYNLVYEPDEEAPDACCEDLIFYNELDDRVPVPNQCL